MKNHIRSSQGQLRQTSKKWSHLKQKQRETISTWLREAYIEEIKAHDRRLKAREHEDVLSQVLFKIREHEIWITEYEVEKYYKGKINKWYNKHISLNLKNYNGGIM
ncbi:transposase [Bacillus paranthracis]|uniref:transposase n=1 Tax=Bacillus TaxID=1386 RepID=UPI000977E0B3|nr:MULTISPECIES: transposase [Bacillus cereus group]MDA2666754.1 transposase [Bacillus cereus group sp. Bc032]MDA2677472.1 transposase [Bacillus cereus group sp. Bc031]MDA2682962.1 transposase [Bacillus cereus group sp. Bc029]MDA2688430.1 transposase [Bacillus cereus group sp. Bc030]MDA2743928.1 transposase [Bacillus cereus group sp. Bc011]